MIKHDRFFHCGWRFCNNGNDCGYVFGGDLRNQTIYKRADLDLQIQPPF
jgi:hypothetical protein